MTVQFLKALVALNRLLSTINGFLFGILVQFSPIHSRKGKPVRIPLAVNVLLLIVLMVSLVLIFRAYFGHPQQPVEMTDYL